MKVNNVKKDWFIIDNPEHLDSPALVFYPERIKENIERLKEKIDKPERLRPHVKTHKSAEITLLMLEGGITKFKCATIAEAEMLGACRAPDVLLAYQLVGPKIDRFIQLVKTFPETSYSCLLDNEVSLADLSHAALNAEIEIDVFIDIDAGMNRTGIKPGADALSLYEKITINAGLNIKGLHIYDGHVHDASFELRKKQWIPIWESIQQLRDSVINNGHTVPVIVAGGTPTFPFYAGQPDIECSPGTFILWDKGYQDAFQEQDYLTAALVVTRVISLREGNKISVDLGHKSIAAENVLSQRVYFLNAQKAEFAGQSEEHLVLDVGANHRFAIGDILYGLPIHICPTVALYERAATIINHQVKEDWNIMSRDRKITI